MIRRRNALPIFLLRLLPTSSTTANTPVLCAISQRLANRTFVRGSTEWLATVAVLVILTVAVAAAPFGVTELGLIVQAVVVGAPLQAKSIVVGNSPPKGLIVIPYVAVAPALTVKLGEALETLKSTPFPVRFTT
jgi:hypothetical protein